MAKRAKKSRRPPAKQAEGASPLNGVVPPPEHRWPPGQSGNPEGRKPAGLSVKEWWNQMQDWPIAKIKDVLTDPDAPASKIAAARTWVDACSDAKNASGMPVAGGDLDRIVEHTDGKATQRHDHTTAGQPFQLIDRPTWDKV